MRPYYGDRSLSVALYDQISRRDPAIRGDADFYAALAPAGASVLELGCGTGRVALSLALKGRCVVGVDLAPPMLDRAEAKRVRLPPEPRDRVSFQQGDMTTLDLGRTFDAVIVPFFSLAHLPLGAPRRAAYGVIARHLKPGAAAAVHLPLTEALVSARGGDTPLKDFTLGDTGRRATLRLAEVRADGDRRDLQMEYAVWSGERLLRQSRELLTFYVDPSPAAPAAEAGLVLERVVPFNRVGEIFCFRRPG
jgi:SAM-dependent methyltransferase